MTSINDTITVASFQPAVQVTGTFRVVFVKICGITSPADARSAAEAGADAVGLNFVSTSPRRVDVDEARSIMGVVPDHVIAVGVFRDQPVDLMLEIVSGLGLHAAQLHGDEPPSVTAAVAEGVGLTIKVVTAGSAAMAMVGDHGADVVMVDGPTPGGGMAFDWDLVGGLAERHRLLLAGGLRPGTVGAAIERVRPWGVDVASGVELGPRRKDRASMERFVTAARAAAAELHDR